MWFIFEVAGALEGEKYSFSASDSQIFGKLSPPEVSPSQTCYQSISHTKDTSSCSPHFPFLHFLSSHLTGGYPIVMVTVTTSKPAYPHRPDSRQEAMVAIERMWLATGMKQSYSPMKNHSTFSPTEMYVCIKSYRMVADCLICRNFNVLGTR